MSQKKLAKLHQRYQAIAPVWEERRLELVQSQTHIPLSEAQQYLSQMQGIALDGYKLSRRLLKLCQVLYEVSEDGDSDFAMTAREKLAPLFKDDE